jgi:glycosyltransferase involved in cell wall biosynthesis
LADAVVAVSKGAANELAAIGIPKNKLAVVYNPVLYPEMLQSAQVPPTHPWFLHHTEAIILGVGRLAPQKDFHTLLDAFALVRRQTAAKLLLLGEGPERGALADMISQLGLEDSVQLLGQVQNPLSYMRHADLFVLSSRFEGLPTVLIEALAVGVPIVSTDCPSGPREILQNGALGVLVPVADPEALAQAIVIELTKERGLPADATPQLEKYTRDYAVSAYRLILQI